MRTPDGGPLGTKARTLTTTPLSLLCIIAKAPKHSVHQYSREKCLQRMSKSSSVVDSVTQQSRQSSPWLKAAITGMIYNKLFKLAARQIWNSVQISQRSLKSKCLGKGAIVSYNTTGQWTKYREVTLVVDATGQSVIPGKIFSFINYFNLQTIRSV